MWISAIEDPLKTPNPVLHTFLPAMPVGEFGFERRNATYSIANINFGTSPFGSFAAPMKSRKLTWQVQVTGFMGYDAARDALNAAVGHGWPVRLVAQHDLGYERVCMGTAYVGSQPFSIDSMFAYSFNVEWELNSFWTERAPVDPSLRMGQGYTMGQGHTMGEGASTVTISSTNFNVPTSLVDASIAGPGGVPNQPDTGPILTIVGPVGGSLGFTLANLTDRNPYNFGNGVVGSGFNFTLPIGAGHVLTIDCGAKSVVFDGTADFSGYLSVPVTQNYWLAINDLNSGGGANQLKIVANGSAGSLTSGGTFQCVWSRYFL